MSGWCYELQIVVRQSLTGLEGSHKAVSLKNEALFILKAIKVGGLLVGSAHGLILITRAVKLNRLPLVRIELTEPLATSLC